MLSPYDDLITTLVEATFSIPNVTIRKPYDESPKTYPLIVAHEIVNAPVNHGTVNGETRTAFGVQLDIQTTNCADASGNVLNKFDVGRLLVGEVSDVLESELKIARRTIRTEPIAPDVLQHTWRGDGILDSYGYVYRS